MKSKKKNISFTIFLIVFGLVCALSISNENNSASESKNDVISEQDTENNPTDDP